MSKIWICPRCGAAYSTTGNVEKVCTEPECGATLVESTWDVEDWRKLTESQKQQEKNKYIVKREVSSRPQTASLVEKSVEKSVEKIADVTARMYDDTSRISHDLHFLYILTIINLVCIVIYGLVIFTRLL